MLLKYLPLLFLFGVSLAASIEEPSVEGVPADADVPDVTSDAPDEEALSAAEGDAENEELECVFTDAEKGEVTVLYTEDEDEVAGVTVVSAEPDDVTDLEEKMNSNCFEKGLQGRRNIRKRLRKRGNVRRKAGPKRNKKVTVTPKRLILQMRALVNKEAKLITRVDMSKLNALSRRFTQAKMILADKNKRRKENQRIRGVSKKGKKPPRNRRRQALNKRRKTAGKASLEVVPDELVEEEEVVALEAVEEDQTESKIE